MPPSPRSSASPPPAFNVPPVVVTLTGLLVAIHVLRNVLPGQWAGQLVSYLAFVPIRYVFDSDQFGQWPGGHFADVWTFLTCFFLQADTGTLIINGAALLILGAAVAWRLGTRRFLLFTSLCVVAGSVTCLATYWGQPVVIVGAGAGISGLFAAAIHFIFKGGSPMAGFQVADGAAFRRPAWPLRDALADQNVRIWLAVFAFINLWYVASYYILVSTGETTGWPGNIGGFAAGLVLFRYFDPKPRLRRVV